MALLTAAFPGCCTASVVYGFGSSYVASDGPYEGFPEGVLKARLQELEENYERHGKAVLVITLNSEQVKEDKILREAGYTHSRWMKKRQHPETKVRLYYKPLDTLRG